MKRYLLFVSLILVAYPAFAKAGSVDWATLNSDLSDATYVKDDQKCSECHEEQMTTHTKTPHAKAFKFSPKPGNEGLDCELCHGPMSKHLDAPRKLPVLAVSFKDGGLAPEQLAAICLQCHEKGGRLLWRGEVHAANDLSCNNCHSIHSTKQSVDVKKCYSCHPGTRAELQRSSHMPVREGKMSCTGCHNPHGSKGPSLLNDTTINDTCYACHAEKRGPFLWEHAPVRESCMNCHNPHGSNHGNLLRIKVPYLCQQCHAAKHHPSTAYSGTNIIGGSSQSVYVLGKSCVNCHSLVHGSNHPSGAVFQR